MSHESQLRDHLILALAVVSMALISGCNQSSAPSASDEANMTEQSTALVPTGPWSQGDQKGMANTLGAGNHNRQSRDA